MRALVPLLAVLPLAACLGEAPPAPAPVLPRADACGAGSLSGLIGQPESALPASGPWGAVRVLRPGAMMTMDFSPTRLDVRVDDSGKILGFSCG